jgi:Ca2+-binding EF-hand superfamily protein
MSTRSKRLNRAAPACALAVAACLAAVTPAAAQHPVAPAEQVLARSIQPGMTLARYLDQRRAEFQSLDLDHDGALTSADGERVRRQAAANARAGVIGEIMRADLDGDGRVTRDEVVRLSVALAGVGSHESDENRRKRVDDAVAERMMPDLDHDGVIDAAEIIAYARHRASAASSGGAVAAIEAALTLDADGKVTLGEYEAAAERVFRAIDTDGDGIVSWDELDAFRRHQAPRRPAR